MANHAANATHVYLVVGMGMMKVGASSNPQRRLKELTASNPHYAPLRLARVWPVSNAPAIEKAVRNLMPNGSMRGLEWYAVSAELAEIVVNNAVRQVAARS